MYAKIDPDSLLDALEPVTTLVDEAKIHVTENGLFTKAVDPANVGMVDMHLDADAFEMLTLPDGTDELVLGVNLNRLTRQVKDINSEPVGDEAQTLHIDLDESTRKITMWANPGSMEFTMALIDPDSIRQEPDIPDMDLPGHIELEESYFAHAVKTAKNYADHITIGMDADNSVFTMAAIGDTDDWQANLDDAHTCVDSLSAATVTSTFSLDYFDDIRKGLQSDVMIRMEIGDDFPIRMMYDFLDSNVSVTYMIAPRIEDDS